MKAQIKFVDYLPSTSKELSMPDELLGLKTQDILFDYEKPDWLQSWQYNMIIHYEGEMFQVMDVDFIIVED